MKPPKNIQSLVPYQPGKPIEETKREYNLSTVYKLASNENPLGPAKAVVQAIGEAANDIHLYPDASSFETKKALSDYFGVASKNMTLGNGSNELIDLLIRTYCQPGDSILTSKAAFIAYKICAKAANINCIETELTSDLKYDVNLLIEQLEKDSSIKILFLANPNNPTGTYLNQSEMNEFMQVAAKKDVLIIFDEAYNEFVRADDFPQGMDYFKQYDNVIVLRTLSKVFALAGLRVGALIAHEDIIGYIDRVRNPFNVNLLAQVAAIHSVKQTEYLEESKQLVWHSLDYFYEQLEQMGLSYYKSQGNFILFDTKRDSSEVYEELLKKGLILRPVKAYGFATHLRMSIGTMKENEQAIQILKEVLGS